MTKKHHRGVIAAILRVLLVIPAFLSLTANLLSMMQGEAAAMRKKVLALITLAMFCMALMMTAWLCVTGLLLVYLNTLHLSMIAALGIVLIFNLLMMLIVGLLMNAVKVDPSFPETRKTIQDILSR